MLVNDKCSSWHSKVYNFVQYQFKIREQSFYTLMDHHAWPDRTTPLQSAWLMTLSAMTVECERFVCLFVMNTHQPRISFHPYNTRNVML